MKLVIRSLAVTIALCLSALNSPVYARDDGAHELRSSINAVVLKHAADAKIDGIVLVAEQGEAIHQAGYGLADRVWNIPNTPKTRFHIASMTKSFTAVLIMQLVQEGQIDLDKTIRTYLPTYPADHGDIITVRQMLTHRSGIKHYAELPGWRDGKYRPDIAPADFVADFAGQPLNFKPGSEYRYSNSNYYLLGLMVETITGQTYSEALQARILGPVGMTNSGNFASGRVVQNLAADYMPNGAEISCTPKSDTYCASGYVNMALFNATGSMYSTANDLLKWDQALYGEQLLSTESKAILFNPEMPFAWSVGSLPLGDTGDTVNINTYNGGINGYTSMIVRFPDQNQTIIILNNSGSGYNALSALAVEIAGVIYEAAGD